MAKIMAQGKGNNEKDFSSIIRIQREARRKRSKTNK